MITSCICKFSDYLTAWYRDQLVNCRETLTIHRKQWEFLIIIQALMERNMVQPGKSGLGFAIGAEWLPWFFASHGVDITATDQPAAKASANHWGTSSQFCKSEADIFRRDFGNDAEAEKRCRFRPVDMNELPDDLGTFDFCWSSCAFEHLGSPQHGMDFVINSCKLLKPGGFGAHTTEYNVSSNDIVHSDPCTVLYRKRDIEALEKRLAEVNCTMEPMDWNVGDHFIDNYPDRMIGNHPDPFHVKLILGEFTATSMLLIVKKLG
jgi:hypothetical protein